MPAGKRSLDTVSGQLHDQTPAELDPRAFTAPQRFAKVTASGPGDNGDVPTNKERFMTKVVNCECGETVRAESDGELVSRVEAHVERDHPDMVGKLSRDDILGMAEEA